MPILKSSIFPSLGVADPLNLCVFARQIGATYANAVETIHAIDKISTYYFASDIENCRSFISTCLDIANEQGVEVRCTPTTIHCQKQEIVTLCRPKPAHLRCLRGRFVIDNATDYPQLKLLIDLLLPTLMSGSYLSLISSLPSFSSNLKGNYFMSLIARDNWLAKLKGFSVHRITFRDAIDNGLYQKICEVTKKAYSLEAQEIWAKDIYSAMGEYAKSELDCQVNWDNMPLKDYLIDCGVNISQAEKYLFPDRGISSDAWDGLSLGNFSSWDMIPSEIWGN